MHTCLDIHRIAAAFVESLVNIRDLPGGLSFTRLIAREISDPLESKRGIVEEYLDPVAYAALELLQAVAPEDASSDPARPMKAKKEPNGRIRYLTPDEDKRLRKVISETYPDFMIEFEFSIRTGARLSEQFALK